VAAEKPLSVPLFWPPVTTAFNDMAAGRSNSVIPLVARSGSNTPTFYCSARISPVALPYGIDVEVAIERRITHHYPGDGEMAL
jgi:hypothetical protein